MNAGKVENCPTLQKILDLLRRRGAAGATTLELHEASGAMSPSTEVSAIRHNGYEIECEYEGKLNGRKVYRYWLIERAPVERRLF